MMPTQFYEGEAQFKIQQAFYNPRSKLVRDLGVLAAIAILFELWQI